MRRILIFAAVASAIASGVAACGDDTSGGSSGTDASAPDGASDAAPRTTLGGTCTGDPDCAEGLVCFKKDDADQWPAHGLCTKKCFADKDCAAAASGAVCTPFGGTDQWCFEPCTLGPNVLSAVNAGPLASKCHGRPDVGCTTTSGASAPFCRPACNVDSACAGETCDSVNGGCTKTPKATWADIGNAPPNACDTGLVLGSGASTNCTAPCVLGVVPGCGWSGPGAVAKAACLSVPAGRGQGDKGECNRLCDTSCDCEGSFLCQPLAADSSAVLGRAGLCVPSATNPIACGDAGLDAGDGGG